jgi:membrane protein
MSLVYTTMIAIVPLLAFAVALLKGLGLHREMQPLLTNFFSPLGPRAEELTQRIVEFVDNISGTVLAGVAIVILLYSAMAMAQKVEGSFNFVWRVDRPRNFARRFTEYLSFMFVGPMLMSVAMGFTATLASAAARSRLSEMEPIGAWLVGLSSLTPYVLVIAGFSVLYILIPNTRVHVKPAVIGGVFAGVLWAGSGNLFTGFVVSVSRMEGIYSGFAIVLVAMIWLHLSWLILLLGAQLAFYLQNPEYLRLGKRTESMSNGLRERLALSTMLLVGHDFDKPGHGWRTESLAAKMRIQRHLLEPVIASLMHADLLTRTADHRLMPARDPRRIALAEIFDAVRNPDRDSSHDNEWNDTVRVLSETVDAAIRAACRDRTLADIVDADTRIQAVAKINEAPPQSGPRAASNQ